MPFGQYRHAVAAEDPLGSEDGANFGRSQGGHDVESSNAASLDKRRLLTIIDRWAVSM
jgi:hypothetical protein